jgi:hypothetical protein
MHLRPPVHLSWSSAACLLLLRPWRFGLRICYRRDQLVYDLATRLRANVIDLLHLNVGILLRVLLGLLVA